MSALHTLANLKVDGQDREPFLQPGRYPQLLIQSMETATRKGTKMRDYFKAVVVVEAPGEKNDKALEPSPVGQPAVYLQMLDWGSAGKNLIDFGRGCAGSQLFTLENLAQCSDDAGGKFPGGLFAARGVRVACVATLQTASSGKPYTEYKFYPLAGHSLKDRDPQAAQYLEARAKATLPPVPARPVAAAPVHVAAPSPFPAASPFAAAPAAAPAAAAAAPWLKDDVAPF